MKKAALKMSLMMGFSMSFILTLAGVSGSGSFTIPLFLKCFATSFAVSFLLGLLVPMKKIGISLMKKLDLRPGTLKARLLDALVFDLGYSPLMTFVMVWLAHRRATAHGARIPFGPMLLRSELTSFVLAFVLSFILTPVCEKIAFRNTDKEQKTGL